MDMSKPFMTSFGIPIIAKFDNCTEEEFKKSIPEKFSNIKLSDFPSLRELAQDNKVS